jgi:hypothetical protein
MTKDFMHTNIATELYDVMQHVQAPSFMKKFATIQAFKYILDQAFREELNESIGIGVGCGTGDCVSPGVECGGGFSEVLSPADNRDMPEREGAEDISQGRYAGSSG